MHLVLRHDLGGRAAALPALKALAAIEITRPVVLFTGGNGCGKSTLFACLRQATGLVGPGLGYFAEPPSRGRPLSLPSRWRGHDPVIDEARHMLLMEDRYSGYSAKEAEGWLPDDAVGVLDPVALGWTGQRLWLHDGRDIDNHDGERLSMNLAGRRRAADDLVRSHGQQMTGRLRYAIAWALGLFDLKDGYDRPWETLRDHQQAEQSVYRQIFARLSGVAPATLDDDTEAPAKRRNPERWLLLDEPETGLDPIVFAKLMALLVDGAAAGRTRVFCATHAALALDLAHHPKVQMIDLDGYALRLDEARRLLANPEGCAQLAAVEMSQLRDDCEVAIVTDRGLEGQGRFTAHEALSIPYPNAIVAPYGIADCLDRMYCSMGKTGRAGDGK